MNETLAVVLLAVTLVVTNLLWFVFWALNHAQHMRAYQWMIGYRPGPVLNVGPQPDGSKIVRSIPVSGSSALLPPDESPLPRKDQVLPLDAAGTVTP